jgi:hypothetical protein
LGGAAQIVVGQIAIPKGLKCRAWQTLALRIAPMVSLIRLQAAMEERLIIHNFAGIKSIRIEINKINIIIGPQASGKSVCAKLLFFFKSFVLHMVETVENDVGKRNLDSSYKQKFQEYFPPESWDANAFRLRYEIGDLFIEISRKQGDTSKVTLDYSGLYTSFFRDLRVVNKKIKESMSEGSVGASFAIPRDFLNEYLGVVLSPKLPKQAGFTQLFIPAGRSFFANLQNSIFSFLSSSNALDPFLIEFGKLYEGYKNVRLRRPAKADKSTSTKDFQEEVERLIEKVICGKHVRIKGSDYLESPDGRRVSLSNSSSGQQETLPLAIILSILPTIASRVGKTVYIEEPEAHLFPEAQRTIVELIAVTFNQSKNNLQFVVTTHSPYVLTALNNLLQAGSLYETLDGDSLESLQTVMPQFKSLEPKDISAYAFMAGGCSTIIEPQTGLIDASIIDSVSDTIAIEFDALIGID